MAETILNTPQPEVLTRFFFLFLPAFFFFSFFIPDFGFLLKVGFDCRGSALCK